MHKNQTPNFFITNQTTNESNVENLVYPKFSNTWEKISNIQHTQFKFYLQEITSM